MHLVEASRGKVQRIKIKRKSMVGQGVLVLVALLVLLLSSFVCVELPTGTGHNLINFAHVELQALDSKLPAQYQQRVSDLFPELMTPVKKLRYDTYTPQAPVAIFLGYVFGWPIATIGVALFLLAGIVGPVFHVYLFASGGGLDYYAQPGFGYLAGMLVATWLVGKITEPRRTSARQIAAVAAGLFSMHFIGIIWILACSLGFAFSDPSSGPDWLPWVFEQIRNLSWYPLPYDAIFAIMLIGIAFPMRYLVNVLTAPDIGLRSQADIMAQQRMEELLR